MLLFLVQNEPHGPSPLIVAILFTLVSLPVGFLVGYLSAYRFKRQFLNAARELANLRGENFQGQLATIGGIARTAPPRKAAPPPPRATPPVESDEPEELEMVGPAPAPAATTPAPTPGTSAADTTEWQAKLAASAEQLATLENQHAATLAELHKAEAAIDILQSHIEDLEGQLDAAESEAAAARSARDAAIEAAEQARAELRDQAAAAPAAVPAVAETSSGTEAWQLAQLHREQIMMQLQLDDHVEKVNQLTYALQVANEELAEKTEMLERLQAESE